MEAENGDAGRLSEILAELEADGYRSQMAARPDGQVVCFNCHQVSDAAALEVAALRRTEGVSDPADMLAVAALTCPNCGAKGTIVLGYGPEADDDDAEVLAGLHVQEAR
ncbi:MAG: hypothetical protein M3179_04965 [Actinomycetota bacterium]|nr:hypothetical protein [Actinomycetota bacterium]